MMPAIRTTIALIALIAAESCTAQAQEAFVLRCTGSEIGVGGKVEGTALGAYEVTYGFPASGTQIYSNVWKDLWSLCSTCEVERDGGLIRIVSSYDYGPNPSSVFDGGSWRRETTISDDLNFSGRYEAFKKQHGSDPIFERRFEGTCEREAVTDPPPWLEGR